MRGEDDKQGIELKMEPETLLSRMRKVVGVPEVTEKEYQEKVEEMAETVLEEYDDEIPLDERIWEMVDGSGMVIYYHRQKVPIYHHQNEPEELRAFLAETDSLTTTLAFVCLLTDVRAKVRDLKEKRGDNV